MKESIISEQDFTGGLLQPVPEEHAQSSHSQISLRT